MRRGAVGRAAGAAAALRGRAEALSYGNAWSRGRSARTVGPNSAAARPQTGASSRCARPVFAALPRQRQRAPAPCRRRACGAPHGAWARTGCAARIAADPSARECRSSWWCGFVGWARDIPSTKGVSIVERHRLPSARPGASRALPSAQPARGRAQRPLACAPRLPVARARRRCPTETLGRAAAQPGRRPQLGRCAASDRGRLALRASGLRCAPAPAPTRPRNGEPRRTGQRPLRTPPRGRRRRQGPRPQGEPTAADAAQASNSRKPSSDSTVTAP